MPFKYVHGHEQRVKLELGDSAFQHHGISLTRYTYEAHEARLVSLHKGFERAARAGDTLPLLGGTNIVHLPEVEMAHLHAAQRHLQVAPRSQLGALCRFAAQKDVISQAWLLAPYRAVIVFAARVIMRRVEQGHSKFEGAPDKLYPFCLPSIGAQNPFPTQPNAGDCHTRFAQTPRCRSGYLLAHFYDPPMGKLDVIYMPYAHNDSSPRGA